MTKRILIGFLLLGLLAYTGASASSIAAENATSVVLTDQASELEAAPYLLSMRHADPNLSLADVRKPELQAQFQRTGHHSPNFGYDARTAWFKLIISNRSDQPEWVLDYDYAPIDRIELFVVKPDGTVLAKQGGDLQPFPARETATRSFSFILPLEQGMESEIYMKVETEGAMAAPLKLYTPVAYAAKERAAYLLLGMFYGMLSVLTLYNTVLAISFRSRAYFYYVAINTSVLFMFASMNGIAYQYVWPNAVWWNNLAIVWFMCLGMLSSIMFTRSFLDGRRFFPRLHRLFLVAAAWEVLTMLAVLADYSAGLHMVMYSTVIVEACIVAAGILSWKAGYGPAKVFFAGWGTFMVGAIISSLADTGYLPYTAWTAGAAQAGSTLEAIILSWALAAKIRQIRKEKELALAEMRETRHLADHDDLTGLYNRRYLTSVYESLAVRNRQVAVLLIDIDYFKQINDTYGHDAGDFVLMRMARLLQEIFRPTDIVGRFGGEEFIVILPETGLESARRAGEYALQAVRDTAMPFGGASLQCTISIGAAEWTGDEADSMVHVLRRADEALYVAKAGGRDQIVATA